MARKPTGNPPGRPRKALQAAAALAEADATGEPLVDVARRHGIAPSTAYAATAGPSQPQAPTKAAKGKPGPATVPSSSYAPPKAPAARPAPLPIPPKADLREELLDLLGQTKGMLADAAVTRRGYSSLGQLLDKIAARIHAIDLSRQEHGSEVAAVLAKGPAALSKVRQGVMAVARREVEQGACCRCGAGLAPDVIVRRRTEAGLDAAPVH